MEAAHFEVRPLKSGLHASPRLRPGFALLNCSQAAQSAAKTKPRTGFLPFWPWRLAVSRGALLVQVAQQRSRPAAFAGERRGHALCQFHPRCVAASGLARCLLARFVFSSPDALGASACNSRCSVLRAQSRRRGCAFQLGFVAHTAAMPSNPSFNRSANGKAPWPRGGLGSSSASRPRRLAVVARLTLR